MIQSDIVQSQVAEFSSSIEPVPHNLAHYDINLAQREPQVLIIDDEPEVAEEVAESLGMKRFTCSIAISAKSGLKTFQDTPSITSVRKNR